MRAEYKTFWLGRPEIFIPVAPNTGNFSRDLNSDWQLLLGRVWFAYHVRIARLIVSDFRQDILG